MKLIIFPFVRNNMRRGQRAKNLLRDLLYKEGIGTAEEKMMAEMDKLYFASKDYAMNCFRYM